MKFPQVDCFQERREEQFRKWANKRNKGRLKNKGNPFKGKLIDQKLSHFSRGLSRKNETVGHCVNIFGPSETNNKARWAPVLVLETFSNLFKNTETHQSVTHESKRPRTFHVERQILLCSFFVGTVMNFLSQFI